MYAQFKRYSQMLVRNACYVMEKNVTVVTISKFHYETVSLDAGQLALVFFLLVGNGHCIPKYVQSSDLPDL